MARNILQLHMNMQEEEEKKKRANQGASSVIDAVKNNQPQRTTAPTVPITDVIKKNNAPKVETKPVKSTPKTVSNNEISKDKTVSYNGIAKNDEKQTNDSVATPKKSVNDIIMSKIDNKITAEDRALARQSGLNDKALKYYKEQADRSDAYKVKKKLNETYDLKKQWDKAVSKAATGGDDPRILEKLNKSKDELKKMGYDPDELLNTYTPEREKTLKAEKNAKDKTFGEQHKILSSLKSIGTGLMRPFEGVSNTLDTAAQMIAPTESGSYRDESDRYYFDDATNNLREGVTEGWNGLGKGAYNIGMSAADMGAQVLASALTGGGSAIPALMQAGQAANSGIRGAESRGASEGQQLATGLSSGALTYLTSKIGLDKIKELGLGGEALLPTMVKGAVAEGAEEGVESIGNQLADVIINRDKSEFMTDRQNAIDRGATNTQATLNALKNAGIQTGQEALAGAVLGGLLAGGGNIMNGRNKANVNENVDNINEDVDNINEDANVDRPSQLELEQQALNRSQLEPTSENPISNDTMTNSVNESATPAENVVTEQVKAPRTTDMFTVNEDGSREINKKSDLYKLLYQRTRKSRIDDSISGTLRSIINMHSPNKDALFNSKNELMTLLESYAYDGNPETKAQAIELANAINDNLNNAHEDYVTVRNNSKNKSVKGGTTISYVPDNFNSVFNTAIESIDNRLSKMNETEDIMDAFTQKYGNVPTDVKGNEAYWNNAIEEADQIAQKNPELQDRLVEFMTNKDRETKGIELTETPLNDTQDIEPDNSKANINNGEYERNDTGYVRQYDEQIGDGKEKTRGYAKSLQKDFDLPEEVKFELKSETYNQLSNEKTKQKAMDVYDNAFKVDPEKPFEVAYKDLQGMLKDKDAAAVPLAYKIANDAIAKSRDTSYPEEQRNYYRDVAIDSLRSVSQELTRAGQFSQAAYMTLLKNDPMTALSSMQKDLDLINEQGSKKFGKKWKDMSLTEDEINEFSNIKAGDEDAILNISDKVYARLAKDFPHTKWEQFIELTKLGMLMNPRTHLRNTVANVVSGGMRSLTDRVSAVGQHATKLFNPDVEVTQSLTGGTKAQKKLAGEYFDTYIKDSLDDNKYNESGTSRLAKESQVFKDSKIGAIAKNGGSALLQTLNNMTGGKLDSIVERYNDSATNSVLENLRQLDYFLLGEVEDTPFVKMNYVNRLASYMKAKGINDIESVPPEAHSIALEEALKATFKDDNRFTKLLSTSKRGLGKFGDVVMPFTKTPANLAARGVDYSPVGLVRDASNAIKKASSKEGATGADIAKSIDDMSKGLTGSALIFLGYALAKKGLITGSYSDDKNEKKFQQLQGFQENAFHVGKKYYTYDWSQPSSIPLILGTAIYEATNKSDKEASSIITPFFKGGKAAVNSWFNLSPLQGVAEIMGGTDKYSGETDIAGNAAKVLTDYPQTLIPSVLGATARTVDPTMRNTYDKTSDAKTWLNQAKAKIPGLSKTLPASYDTWGRERKRSNSKGEAAFAQFINPGTLGNDMSTEIDDEIIRLGKATDLTKVYPKASDYSIQLDNEKKVLNNEEYSKLQKAQGEKSFELAKAFIKSSTYKNMSDDERADTLNKLYGTAKEIAQNKLFGKSYSMDKAEEEAYKKGTKAYIEYFGDKSQAKKLNVGYEKYKEWKDSGLKPTEIADKAKTYNMVKDLKAETGNKENYKKSVLSGDYSIEEKGTLIMANEPDKKQTEMYNKFGNEGVVHYTNAKAEYDKGMGKDKNYKQAMTNLYNYLSRQSMKPAEKSAIISSLYTSKQYTQAAKQFGDTGAYQLFTHKRGADTNGNGKVDKKEAMAYINKSKISGKEWYLLIASNSKKNPYK